VDHLQKLYPHFHLELAIKYTDQEGDKISVGSQIEWEEMFLELEGGNIKIYVEEGNNSDAYFKDGPNPEPLCFYEDVITKVPVEVNNFISDLKERVPKCLEFLYRDGKIIPSNIPAFLADAIKPKYLGPDVVDLDIDIYKLFDLLHSKSMECLESVDRNVIQKGKEYLLSMLQMMPDHTTTLYNLACAESLLNNIPESLQALEKAVEAGYSNVTHMLQDNDLNNIKGTEAFAQLLEKIQAKIQEIADKVVPPKEEVKVEEPKVEEFSPEESDIINNVGPVVLEYDSSILDTSVLNAEIKVEKMNTSLTDSFIDLRIKWQSQINQLKAMGFQVDDEVLSLLLEQCNGKEEDVINILIQTSTR
jgi:hypothetical protein